MDWFIGIVMSVVLAGVSAGLTYFLKKLSDKTDSETLSVLMHEFRDILSSALDSYSNEIIEAVKSKVDQVNIENKFVTKISETVNQLAPKLMDKLEIDQKMLEEYARNIVKSFLQERLGEEEK